MPSEAPQTAARDKAAFVGLRLSPRLLERVDAYAEGRGIGRSEAVRALVEAGLS